MSGWVKLHRKIQDNPVWQDPYFLKLWMLCLMKASHKKREQMVGNQVVNLEPGEFVTGRKALADEFNEGAKKSHKLSPKTIERKLDLLQNLEMLTIKKTTKYSVISINNWTDYQQSDHQVTIKRPSNDHQVTTNKNLKNVKNKERRKSQIYDQNSIHYQLANRLYQNILKNNPNHKKPNLHKWADTVRLMMEQDERTEEQIRYVIDWCQKDDFWSTNILSTNKLRKQFDAIVPQIQREKRGKSKEPTNPTWKPNTEHIQKMRKLRGEIS